MNTIQTNVRVQPDDKPLVRAIAARLRLEPHFRERLRSLLEDDPTPALKERIAKLEERVEYLMAGSEAPARAALHHSGMTVVTRVPTISNGNGNGSHASS